ncbi:hypothetical protein B0H67DRAFT_599826 [Lasiosphaeris hirsuta]|uniref:Uncharacterized protein n=1 Tax=Lasiosphaeris hirsuta TaxID=260670 RepID=A0AA40AQT8_9PEZI|nr:hypothetical protein B0H67DRAFT_599826 [Lasiosphaeris hirsuta]
MCNYYYLHHHHMPPCNRDIDMVVHYVFCKRASTDASGSKQPCNKLQYDETQNIDYNDPCASGGCLASPDCSSGACRLAELDGRWRCCQCNRGGNEHRWCRHRMRGSPDTFCYHVCCAKCQADPKKR